MTTLERSKGLHTVGIGSLLGAINFIVTTQNMRSTAVTLDQISMLAKTNKSQICQFLHICQNYIRANVF
ncbi:hypothetical protein X798_02462 [Onchocerca flexuosa]|uniref:Uncharacterized protein n=1 Tax=Onchocerca flexuosa TaxID=387005 RepID=A0A238BYZ4_9BILA|nr:hypothetical protein X798_02462 [Onchocerca flexuosa]